MPRLSVIMIVKDEADCLAECLASVQPVADEIVVVDTGSNDDTVAIAESFTAKVVHMAWVDDFAQARNRSITEASGDWLLHMDADEVLDEEGAQQIRALVDDDGAGADAIEVTLANYCDDPRAWRWVPVQAGDAMARGFSGYLPVGLLRLFRNRPDFEYREAVHENITASVEEGDGVIMQSDLVIHHYGYEPDPAKNEAKAALYLRIARAKMESHPEDVKALGDFAEQANASGLTDEAEAACRRAQALNPLHLETASTLANILMSRGELDGAKAVLLQLEEEGISPPHVVIALGAIALKAGKLEEAQRRLEAVTIQAPRQPMARLVLARVYDRLGETEHALRELQLTQDLAPGIQEFQDRVKAHQLRSEGEAFAQNSTFHPALECLVAAMELDGEDPVIHNDLGVVLYQLGEVEKARESIARALQLAPGWAEAQENLTALGG